MAEFAILATIMSRSGALKVFLIFVIGTSLAVFMAVTAYRAEARRVDEVFRRNALDNIAAIENGAQVNLDSVVTLATFFSSSTEVTRADFHQFTESIRQRHPGIQALEWVPRVPDEARSDFERRARREIPDFQFTDRDDQGNWVRATGQEVYFPVYYVEPLLGNEAALGYAPANHVRNDAIHRAEERGTLQISQPTTIVQSPGSKMAILAFAPVYRQPSTLNGVRTDDSNLVGLTEGVFLVEILVNEALSVFEPSGKDLKLWDITDDPATLIHTHRSRLADSGVSSWRHCSGPQPITDRFDLGGRSYKVTVQPHPGFYEYEWSKAALIGLTVTCLSALLAGFTAMLIRREHSVRQLVKLRTEELSYQATHDALTGLINRFEFSRRLQAAIDRCRSEDTVLTLGYLDLDQFKVVNDTCGHLAGDQLLRELSQLLQTTVRQSDTLARLGGDEFGLILYGCGVDRAREVAETIVSEIQNHRFSWEGTPFTIGVSIGVVEVDRNTEDATIALSQADAACYMAKEKGRGRFHFHTADGRETDMFRRELEWLAVLRHALESHWFVLRRQPIVHTDTIGEPPQFFEILVGLQTPDGSRYRPGAFLPAAERFKLMPALDRWVIRRSLWLIEKTDADPDTVWSINLSGQSLGDAQFVEDVEQLIHQSSVQPSSICFEITETVVIANLSETRNFINRLRNLGFQFSLDDFGIGMSSLSYLKNLPVDFLKIDGSFIKGLTRDRVNQVMVRSINDIARVAGIRTVAECVETEEQLNVVRDLGIDFVQGFHLGRPEPFVNPAPPISEAKET